MRSFCDESNLDWKFNFTFPSLAGDLIKINLGILFYVRWLSCPAAEMVDGSKVLYFEQVVVLP